MDDEVYLIWSHEHGGWWKAGGWGYAKGLSQAGHYTRQQAFRICRDATPMASRLGTISEIPVRLADVAAMLEGGILPACIYGEENAARSRDG
jgi:hypothetical protein